MDYYPLSDLLYRTVALTDDPAEGDVAVVEAYDTDAYGNTLVYSGPGVDGTWFTDNDVATDDPTCRFVFAGREFDPETQLYFYRARCYHTELGRFVSRDPAGYVQFLGLYCYAGGDPAAGTDPTGLVWIVNREEGSQALAKGEHDTVENLAKKIGLNELEFRKWLEPADGKGLPATEKEDVGSCRLFRIPNTVIAYWGGALGGFGKFWVMWDMDVSTLRRRGFLVLEKELPPVRYESLGVHGRNIPGARTHAEYHQQVEAQIRQFLGWLESYTADKTLHGIFFWGHGGFSLWTDPGNPFRPGTRAIWPWEMRAALRYELGLGILWGCHMMEHYGDPAVRHGMFSQNAIVEGGRGLLVPHGFHLFGPTAAKIVPPGAQGTRQ